MGVGAFGKVFLVEKNDTGEYFAMKVLKKELIKKRNQKIHTIEERKIMEETKNNFIIDLHFAFQDSKKLYLVMDFMQGGNILN